jgi:hypothetical protein
VTLCASLLLAAAVAAFGSCSSHGARATSPQASAGAPRKSAPKSLESEKKSGSQQWEEVCGRCHNFRSPSSYDAAGWDVAMRHMRLRANLTADEAKAITEFLKSGAEAGPKTNERSQPK